MSTLGYYYFKFSLAVIASPIFICIAAVLLTWRMTRLRWVAHIAIFAVLLLIYPVYVRIGEIIEPSSIGNPGNGIGYMLHFPILLVSVLAYAAYAWLTRTKFRAVRSVS